MVEGLRRFYLSLFVCMLMHIQVYSQPVIYNFKRADSVAALYHNHALGDLRILSSKLVGSFSNDAEKFRAIYKWVCENIGHDYDTYLKNQKQRQKLKTAEELISWNKEIKIIVFRNLLQHRKTVCTGYAYLIKELSNYAGLKCEIIDGYGKNATSNFRGPAVANHQWNAVYLNNIWYLADATWSAGVYNIQEHNFKKKYDDAYFLADPKKFVRNHYPLDTAWLLLSQKPTLDQFVRRPLIYREFYKYCITDIFPETFDIEALQGVPVLFGFSMVDRGKVKKAILQIERDTNKSNIDIPLTPNEDGFFSVTHSFSTKGRRAVHVVLNDEYVVSFSVKVE